MPPVLVIHDRPSDVAELLRGRFPAHRFEYATTPEAVLPALREHDPEVVLSLGYSGFPGRSHRPAVEHPTVRWVHVGGSGYEHMSPWNPARVQVTNSVGVLAPFLAESVTAAMLALNGHFPIYAEQQRRREWRPVPFRPIAGQTLAVIGLGHIGECVARNAAALGMHVIGLRRTAGDNDAVDEVLPLSALHEALARADVVSVHLRLTDATRHLMNAAAFAVMRRGALFINTARGAVVDELALVEALRSGRLGGAYLDVFESEPLSAESPLWGLPNLLVTPHASDNVHDFPARFASLFADNFDRYLAGEPLLNPVQP